MPDDTYAGDLSPKESWEILAQDSDALLIDVRTTAEFAYVGSPDLSSLGKETLRVQWQIFPDMNVNPEFVGQLMQSGAGKDAPILFICRSGVRSRHAAEAITAAGFTKCYNVAGGFEGDRDDKGHRGTVNGWKVDGLPWLQG
ncbi:MAG: rhodanese-like domain-containing protein [Rhodospirillales bacterium]